MLSDTEVSSKLKIANVLKISKKYKLASAVYNEIIEQNPMDFRAYFNLAQLMVSTSDGVDTAIELFKKVISINPSILDSYSALGAVYIKLKQPQLAVDYCRAGLSVDPSDSQCLYNINVALRQVGLIDEAISLTWKSTGVDRSLFNSDTTVYLPGIENTLSVVCIKWGKKYGAEYVNKLHNAVMRHAPHGVAVRFICFTDDASGIVEEVECHSFDPSLTSFHTWWLKSQVFSSSLVESAGKGTKSTPILRGWVLYIDLDTIVCDSLSFLNPIIESKEALQRIFVLNAEDFKNEARPRGINSSLMLWHAGRHTYLYQCIVDHYTDITRCIYKFDHYLEMMLLDRAALGYLQDLFPGKVGDFSAIHGSEYSHVDCAVVCFPLKPKPHEVAGDELVASHWW